MHDDLVSIVYAAALAPGVVPHPDGEQHASMIIQWDADHFPAFNYTPFSFQAVLFDNGDIALVYDEGNPELGFGSTTGIQNGPGIRRADRAVQYVGLPSR